MRILIAAPPKTGNVWVEQLLSSAYGLEWLHVAPPSANADFPEWARTEFPDDAIVHQHYGPTERILGTCDELGIDLVTTLRNPYDQFVSLYFYAQRFSEGFRDRLTPASVMVGRPIDDPAVVQYLRTGFRPNLEVGVAWIESGRSQILRYEELHSAPEDALLRISSALGPVGIESVRRAIEDAKPDRMRSMNKHVHAHIRSATTEDWRNHLSDAHLEAMAEHSDLVEQLGYKVELPGRGRRVARIGAGRSRRRRRASKPFVITSLGQTGATHLRYLLDSHPDVRCHGELFDPEDAYYATSGLTDHHRYLDELDPSEYRSVVGFELGWASIRSYPQVLDLFHDARRKVVRVRRDNLLDQYVATALPWYTNYRHLSDDDEARTVHVDLDQCLGRMHEWFVNDRILDELLRHSSTLDVEFDALDDEATRASVEQFLGVAPAPLSSPLEQMPAKPLPEVIENWDEVEATLRGTVWQRFLPDSSGDD